MLFNKLRWTKYKIYIYIKAEDKFYRFDIVFPPVFTLPWKWFPHVLEQRTQSDHSIEKEVRGLHFKSCPINEIFYKINLYCVMDIIVDIIKLLLKIRINNLCVICILI